MKEIEKRAMQYINENDLNSKSRKRVKNYMRIALARALRDNAYTTTSIGEMLNREHCTVLHMLKNYSMLSQYSDFKKVEVSVKEKLGMNTTQELEDRILSCANYWEMKILQEEILKTRSEKSFQN